MALEPIDTMVFEEAFRNGLRPDSKQNRNSQYLAQCSNLKATEWGLKALPVVSYPISSPSLSMTWPHMQLERVDQSTMLLLTATAVYDVALDWTASALTTYDATDNTSTKSIPAGTGYWQVAGFQNSWFATKGNALVYRIPSNTSNRVVVEDTNIFVNALANWNNRLVVGGLSGDQLADSTFTDLFAHWRENSPGDVVVDENSAVDSGWVLWSDIGGGDNDIPFTALMAVLGLPTTTVYTNKWKEIVYGLIETGQMGFFPLKHGGTIYAMKQYGAGLAVYAQNSVSILSMNQDGSVREDVLVQHGACGRGCVAGDEKEHVWLSRQGDLYRTQLNVGHTRLGYDEFVGTLTQASVVAAHDPLENDFFFSDGTNGFLLSRTGLTKSSGVMPSSLLRMSGTDGLVGTHVTASDPQAAVVETCLFDFNERFGAKILSYANLATTDTSGWTVTGKYRFNKQGNLASPTAVTADHRGNARLKVSGIEFSLLMNLANRKLGDLERVEAIKGAGKPSLRKWLDESTNG